MNRGNSRSLRTLPREKAFYFFTSIGNYTGESASSLKEFKEKINQVDMKSLEFHFYRGDFERWIADALQDKELTESIKELKKKKLTGEKLRLQLHSAISKRYKKLKSRGRSSQITDFSVPESSGAEPKSKQGVRVY